MKDFFGGQFARFVLVGASNFIVSFATFEISFQLFRDFPGKVFWAQMLSYASGIIWSFYWNRRFTFKARGPIVRQLKRFLVLQMTLLFATSAFLSILVEVLGSQRVLAWFGIMGVATVMNFIMSKQWAFR